MRNEEKAYYAEGFNYLLGLAWVPPFRSSNDESDSVPLLSHASRLFQKLIWYQINLRTFTGLVCQNLRFFYDTLHTYNFYMRNDAFPTGRRPFLVRHYGIHVWIRL